MISALIGKALNCQKLPALFSHKRGGRGHTNPDGSRTGPPERADRNGLRPLSGGEQPSKEVPVLDAKFFSGLALGMIAGMLLLDSSKDVKKLVEKGKDAVQEKISEMKKD